jgi:hypothetical protein
LSDWLAQSAFSESSISQILGHFPYTIFTNYSHELVSDGQEPDFNTLMGRSV